METISNFIAKIYINLSALSESINKLDISLRIHRDNAFNRRFSVVLSSYEDLKIICTRLERNIIKSIEINRKAQTLSKNHNSGIYPEPIQALLKEASELDSENQVDFKAGYMFAKIFLDHYVSLVIHIFNWRGIGGKSITDFFHKLEKYSGTDKQILSFKDKCLDNLKAVNIFITEYRDSYIVHDQTAHKETRWNVNEMNGDIRIIGGRPSITPRELVFVVSNYISKSALFVIWNIQP